MYQALEAGRPSGACWGFRVFFWQGILLDVHLMRYLRTNCTGIFLIRVKRNMGLTSWQGLEAAQTGYHLALGEVVLCRGATLTKTRARRPGASTTHLLGRLWMVVSDHHHCANARSI